MNRHRNRNYPLAGAAVLTVSVIVAGYFSLNRTVTVDNPSLGILKYHYRWGKPYSLAADTNRDGKDDFLASYQGFSDFSHSPGREHWEDRNHDGTFDLHVLYNNGEIAQIELDRDYDGRFEVTASGAQGRAILEDLKRP